MKDMENSNLIVPENRIVLIDDDPVYNSVLLKYAEMAGVQMDVYESLEQMGTIGALGRYDAAIVDYDLGSLTGIEVGEYLSVFFDHIPMVLVSSSDRKQDLEDAWPSSILKFCIKSDGHAFVLNEAIKCLDN
jgi:DNA-binding response OmpR family regulator